jgi:uncharacterized protein YegJ (DUF2314 family)
MRQILTKTPLFSAAVLVALLVRLFTSGLSPIGVVSLVVCVAWFSLDSIRHLLRWRDERAKRQGLTIGRRGRPASPSSRERASGEAQDLASGGAAHLDPPTVSLVYFLSDQRSADEAAIERLVSGALDVTFLPPEVDPSHLVMAVDPGPMQDGHLHFFVVLPVGTFAILISPAPYIENPAAFARESIRDKRLRTAIENHQAWVSVDFVEETSTESKETLYSAIGKIMAALAGPDCLAIYSPELQRCNEFDPSLLETLAGGRPLDLFDEPTFEPIIEIADDDPRMAAAVKKARKRWPEFVEAFAARDDPGDEAYLIKAEFREAELCEFMWVSVREIGEESVGGILMNDPHELMGLHRGVEVAVPLERLNDWIFPKADGSHAGGFTLDVLAEEEEGG